MLKIYLVCSLPKQHRLHFRISHMRSSNIFDSIHVDFSEPYKQASLSGPHYVFTIIDYFSQATWTFLLRNKFNVFETSSFILK